MPRPSTAGGGAVGLLIGGMWEFRGGELFGGTFGVAAGYLGAAIVRNVSMGKRPAAAVPRRVPGVLTRGQPLTGPGRSVARPKACQEVAW